MNWNHVRKTGSSADAASNPGGLAHWLLTKFRGVKCSEPRLALLERITLAPRQTLTLVEADGRRFLIATSAEGAPAFYPLEAVRVAKPRGTRARASW